ncbi:unnamed protein product [Pleuronectes platessa]|uniref:Uncharacterized protein n=1 Tax=Pleuronectes platessa TaxID=8262 RepID=A0A9N7Z6K9_PLEPL|nr:unnamed protein product [Pleuronectes platessa]
MEKENEKVLASGPKGDETAAGENSNYGTELQKGGGRDELEEREEVEKLPPSPFFYSSKQTPPLSPFMAAVYRHGLKTTELRLTREKWVRFVEQMTSWWSIIFITGRGRETETVPLHQCHFPQGGGLVAAAVPWRTFKNWVAHNAPKPPRNGIPGYPTPHPPPRDGIALPPLLFLPPPSLSLSPSSISSSSSPPPSRPNSGAPPIGRPGFSPLVSAKMEEEVSRCLTKGAEIA